MEMSAVTPVKSGSRKRSKIVGKRLAVQLIFIFVHVALIKFAIPNLLWAVIGLLFWGGLVYWTSRTGTRVCSSFCWLGGIQDLMYGFAKKRVSFSPKITQWIVLVILFCWVPFAWILTNGSTIMDMSDIPIQNPMAAEENLFTQFGHFLVLIVVGLGVTVFGARGICHYFCPFGMVVQFFRNRRLKKSAPL
jgi:polyferredoxin